MVLRWCFDNVGEESDLDNVADTNYMQDIRLGAIQSRIWCVWVAVCFSIWVRFTPTSTTTASNRLLLL